MMTIWVDDWPVWPIICLPSGEGAKLIARGVAMPTSCSEPPPDRPGAIAAPPADPEIAAEGDGDLAEVRLEPARALAAGPRGPARRSGSAGGSIRSAASPAEGLLERVEGQGSLRIGIGPPIPLSDQLVNLLRVARLVGVAGLLPGLLEPRLPASRRARPAVLKAMSIACSTVTLSAASSRSVTISARWCDVGRGRLVVEVEPIGETARARAGPGSSSRRASSCSSASSRRAGSRSAPGRTSGGSPSTRWPTCCPGSAGSGRRPPGGSAPGRCAGSRCRPAPWPTMMFWAISCRCESACFISARFRAVIIS